jgi:aminoglycoside phosphotransferase (APT) family kinase protein
MLDNATLVEMLAPVFPGKAIATAEALSGGLANTNYKVTLAGRNEPVVVRIYTREPEACQKELDIYHLVHERVRMAEVLYADVEGRIGGRPYMVTGWVDGVKLDALLENGSGIETRSVGNAVGETLAAIASFHFPQAGFFGPELRIAVPFDGVRASWQGYVEGMLSETLVQERLGKELALRLQRLIRKHAALLDSAEGRVSLVHGDYKAQNLLLRRTGEAWEMAAALDWEFATAETILYDLAILLRYRATLSPEFEAGVVEGFCGNGGYLPMEWSNITRLLDLVNLLTFLNMPERGGAMVDDVTRLVRATVADFVTA